MAAKSCALSLVRPAPICCMSGTLSGAVLRCSLSGQAVAKSPREEKEQERKGPSELQIKPHTKQEPEPRGGETWKRAFCYCRRPPRRAADASPIQSCTSRLGLLSELPGFRLGGGHGVHPQPLFSPAVSSFRRKKKKKNIHLAASANPSHAAEDLITVVMTVTTHWPSTSQRHSDPWMSRKCGC